MNAREGVCGTITVQHLLLNRNALFSHNGQGGLRPHHYCLPVLKREEHRAALVKAATSGSTKFFAGTDSAPHAQDKKENCCGCAGCFTAPAALELYCHVFDLEGKLDKLEGFVSHHGADFYKMARNRSKVRLTKETWTMPASCPVEGSEPVVPFFAGDPIQWKAEKI